MKHILLTAVVTTALVFSQSWDNHVLGENGVAPAICLDDSEPDENILSAATSYNGLEYDVKNKTLTVRGMAVTVTGASSARRIALENGAAATLDGVYLENSASAPLSAEGAVVLRLVGHNTIKSMGYDPALFVRSGAELTITSDHDGCLSAITDNRSAAVGGSFGFSVGSITIKNARLAAVSKGGPAIGCAGGKLSGDITINNSDVFFRGGENSSAIARGNAPGSGVLKVDNKSRVLAMAMERPAIDEAFHLSADIDNDQAAIINCHIKNDIYDRLADAYLKSPDKGLRLPMRYAPLCPEPDFTEHDLFCDEDDKTPVEGAFAPCRYFAATVRDGQGKLYLKCVFHDESTLTLYESGIYKANGKADKDGIADGDRFQLTASRDYSPSVIDGMTRTVEYVRLITLSDGTSEMETIGIFDYPDYGDHIPVEKCMAEAFDTGLDNFVYDVSGWYANPRDETFSYRLNGEDGKSVQFHGKKDVALYGRVSELKESITVDTDMINEAIESGNKRASDSPEQTKSGVMSTPGVDATPAVK